MSVEQNPTDISEHIENQELLFENTFGQVLRVCAKVVLVRATGSYIPIDDFKELFMAAGEAVRNHGFDKLIFDKRNLKVFHQPSMVWYFVHWKEIMFELGLKTHRKILPKDPVFRECVKLGRENLAEEYPDAKFHQMDIQYRFSVEEAIAD